MPGREREENNTTMAKAWAKPFYSSPQWRDARHAALVRDRFTCQMCGARAEEVHHLTELSPLNINDENITLNLSNLQSLCHECHTRITQRVDEDCGAEFVFDSEGQLVKKID